MNTESPKTKKSGRGGKRKGAGRKSTSRTTKLMRVPENCPHITRISHKICDRQTQKPYRKWV